MSLTIPPSTPYQIEREDRGYQVWAVQRVLNVLNDATIVEDGIFGEGTEEAVKRYQVSQQLVADGKVGSATQRRMIDTIQSQQTISLPAGLLRSVIEGESGGYIGAVNWSVPGGVDCGYTQRRVYEADYSNVTVVKRAFDGPYQVGLLARQIKARRDKYREYPAAIAREADKYAWRLAVLYHNWPYAADRLAKGYELSTKTAAWVPQGTKFADGTPVVTYRDWAAFYSMGSKSHAHEGQMVKHTTFGVPSYG